MTNETARLRAWRLLEVHALRAADALHPAAALVATEERPSVLDFVTFDERLAEAAEREGFSILHAATGGAIRTGARSMGAVGEHMPTDVRPRRASVRSGGRRWHVGALALLAGCARSQPVPAPPATGAPGLTVTLAWSAPVDLDLYVTEPGLETAYYALPRTRAGGMLEVDVRCADGAAGGGRERVHWTEPPPGGYRVGVDLPEVCRGRAQEVPYRVAVELDGRVRVFDGRARLGVREPRVVEFVVPGRRTEGAP